MGFLSFSIFTLFFASISYGELDTQLTLLSEQASQRGYGVLPQYLIEQNRSCSRLNNVVEQRSCVEELKRNAEKMLSCPKDPSRWPELMEWNEEGKKMFEGTLKEASLLKEVEILFLQVSQSASQLIEESGQTSNPLPRFSFPAPEWRVRAFEDPAANAYALPDGGVWISNHFWEGSLFESKDIRAVLAHEVAHVVLNHSQHMGCLAVEFNYGSVRMKEAVEVFAQDFFGMSSIGKSRQKLSQKSELEADQFALTILRRAGENPEDMANVIAKMMSTKKEEGFSSGSHPELEDRLQRVQQLLNASKY